jgi:hypothetical protein
MLVNLREGEEMLVSTGPIALARPGWGLKEGTIVSLVSNDSGGRPDVLCAQMLAGAAISGVKTLVLLNGLRTDDDVWKAIGDILGGGNPKAAAQEMRHMKLVMYASGTGREHVGKAELVYAPGLNPTELSRLSDETTAPILTLSDLESEVVKRLSSEVIRVGGDAIVLDAEGFEVPVVFDPSGPVYRVAE